MAAKLSAAHVAVGTFSTEFAAHSIVNPIIVRAITQGLNEANTRFFLQARNPLTLCKAISDALECEPIAKRSTALWYQTPRPSQRYTTRPQNSYYPRQSYNPSYRGRPYQQYYSNQGYENQPRNITNKNQRGYRSINYSNSHFQQRMPNATSTERSNNNNRVYLGNANDLEDCPNSNEEHDEIINLFR